MHANQLYNPKLISQKLSPHAHSPQTDFIKIDALLMVISSLFPPNLSGSSTDASSNLKFDPS